MPFVPAADDQTPSSKLFDVRGELAGATGQAALRFLARYEHDTGRSRRTGPTLVEISADEFEAAWERMLASEWLNVKSRVARDLFRGRQVVHPRPCDARDPRNHAGSRLAS
jgi:hypothetical protein